MDIRVGDLVLITNPSSPHYGKDAHVHRIDPDGYRLHFSNGFFTLQLSEIGLHPKKLYL